MNLYLSCAFNSTAYTGNISSKYFFNFTRRLHDLLIEKTELQENVESLKTEYEEKIKSLIQENGYLSEVVRELKKHFLHVDFLKVFHE